jgi:hypothetical protein
MQNYIFIGKRLSQRKVLLLSICVLVPLLAGWLAIHLWEQSQYIGAVGIDELWNMQYEGKALEGKTAIIRGDAVADPRSTFRFNGLYLVNTETPNAGREPSGAFWFGVRIADSACTVGQKTMTCKPFDPTQAKAFEFKGTLHLVQVGKRPVMSLSNIDFTQSRQLIDGKWQQIPLGVFELPLEQGSQQP